MLLSISLIELLQIIPLLGFIQGAFVCYLIITNTKLDRHKSIFIVLHLFSLSVLLLLPIIEQQFGWKYAGYIDAFVWLIAPSIYLYIKSFSQTLTRSFLIKHLSVFLPALITEIFFFTQIAVVKYSEGQYELEPSNFYLIFSLIKLTYISVYLWRSKSSLKRHLRFMEANFSETSPYDLHWVNTLIGVMQVITLFAAIVFLSSYLPQGLSIAESNLVMYLILMVYIYYAFMKGMQQKNVQVEIITRVYPEGNENQEKKEKYVRSKIKEEEARDIIQQVRHVVEQEELFLDADLTLNQLAAKLGISSYKISQALNQSLKLSFYDLINGYRINRAKELLLDPRMKNLTFLAIAYEAGFNSKSTFNNVFKKQTGQTPTEFLKETKETILS